MNTSSSEYNNETSYRYFGSVGIGSYAADVRPIIGSTGIAPQFSLPAPFYIPYRALASNNVRNLLASGKLMAQTYVTNSAYRLHPIEWASGSAAGAAAAILHRDDMSNHELLEITALRDYQNLVATNSPIRWDYTSESSLPPEDGDLVVNSFEDLLPAVPFEVEACQPSAVRAVIEVDGNFFDETILRANGRLYLNSPGISVVSADDELDFVARLFDSGSNEIAVLTAAVPYGGIPCDSDPTVSDNDDGSVFSTTGSWSVGTAQADRYCEGSYQFLFGTSAPGIATWELQTPQLGMYRISVWYSAAFNRATDAPYTVYHRDGQATIDINQQNNGGEWVELGEFPFEPGSNERVTLTNVGISNTSQLVNADAVRAELTMPLYTSEANWVFY